MTRLALPLALAAALSAAARPLGRMKSLDFESRFVLAAPHGEFDHNTAPIAWAVCPKIGWDCAAAEGYRRKEHPINVSRPTEGYGLKSSADEVFTERAKEVYERYLATIREVNPEPALLVELHGNSRKESAGALEIATVGLSAEESAAVKEIFIRALREAGLPDIGALVEGVDAITYKAGASKKWGSLSVYPKVLHIEAPKALRTSEKKRFEKALIRALPEAARRLFP